MHAVLLWLQEPDVFGMRWEPANGKPGYADLCIKLMDAAYSIVPDALFLVEGTAQSGLAYNWGERRQSLHAKQLLLVLDVTRPTFATDIQSAAWKLLRSSSAVRCKRLTAGMIV